MPVDEKWTKVDWSKRDVEIAEEMKLSRERVRQMRKKLDQPPPLRFYKKRDSLEERVRRDGLDTRSMTADEIAKRYGVGESSVYYSDLPFRSRFRAPQPHNETVPWDKADWEEEDEVIAAQLGTTARSVATYRHRKGIRKRKRWNKTIYRSMGVRLPSEEDHYLIANALNPMERGALLLEAARRKAEEDAVQD